MSRPYTHLITADCHDCGWQDHAAGCHGRAAQHHDRTGHEVEVNAVTTYNRAGAPPGQTELTYIGDPQ
jgi:hypothetical protein